MSKAISRPSVSAIVGLLAMWTPSAFAESADQGRQFAYRVCSVCHQVAPHLPAGVPPAPAFASIANSKQFRAKQARLLWEAHGSMPNFALTADEAADLAAYIRSLKGARPARK